MNCFDLEQAKETRDFIKNFFHKIYWFNGADICYTQDYKDYAVLIYIKYIDIETESIPKCIGGTDIILKLIY